MRQMPSAVKLSLSALRSRALSSLAAYGLIAASCRLAAGQVLPV